MRDWRAVGCIVLSVLAAAQCRLPYLADMDAEQSVYRVQVTLHVEGVPVRSRDGKRVEVADSWSGSAAAVSADGDLLTAGHVVNPGYGSPELCDGMYYSSSWMILLRDAKLIRMDISVFGPGPVIMRGVAIAAIEGPVCAPGDRPRLIWDPTGRVSVVAVDPVVDLALMHITASGIPYLEMERTAPAPHTPVVAFGEISTFVAISVGEVSHSCTMEGSLHPYRLPGPRLVMSLELAHGMSGGPLVADGRLVGINIQTIPPFTAFATPTTYAAPWYDWVKGNRVVAPLVKCPPAVSNVEP